MEQLFSKLCLTLAAILVLAGCDLNEDIKGKMPPVLALGKFAPDFEFHPLLQDKSGGEANKSAIKKLSDFRGKVVYLDFWASWCAPCIKSMPLLNRMYNELKAEGFEVVAVNLDEKRENAAQFLDKYPVDYAIVRALSRDIELRYKIAGLPTAYLIDRDGKLRFAHQGFKPQDITQIRQQAVSLLNDNNDK